MMLDDRWRINEVSEGLLEVERLYDGETMLRT